MLVEAAPSPQNMAGIEPVSLPYHREIVIQERRAFELILDQHYLQVVCHIQAKIGVHRRHCLGDRAAKLVAHCVNVKEVCEQPDLSWYCPRKVVSVKEHAERECERRGCEQKTAFADAGRTFAKTLGRRERDLMESSP